MRTKLHLFILLSFFSAAFSGESENMHLGGAFLGVFNSFQQADRAESDPARRQFDLAANLDFSYRVHRRIRGVVQLQMGGGDGSVGFVGSSVTVTDLNLEIELTRKFLLTFGSFDTPFGLETPALTNNGDASNNSLLLNSLFYSAFAGTNVGTLNTIGLKGDLNCRFGTATLAITNGTDEEALNPDGNFGLVLRARSPHFWQRFTSGASFIFSDDQAFTGESGTGSRFSSWMLDGIIDSPAGHFLKAYYGRIAYGDRQPATEDQVSVWKIEGKYVIEKIYVAAKLSTWQPQDTNGNGTGISQKIPNPGYAVALGDVPQVADMAIHRWSAGGGVEINGSSILKLELFWEDYSPEVKGKSFDVYGALAALNVLF